MCAVAQTHAAGVIYKVVQTTLNKQEIQMTKKFISSLMAAMFLALTIGALAGCNTMAGAGKDIEKGGAAIEKKANENK
jgi:predicted small secreted protein